MTRDILIVDDEVDIRSLVSGILSDEGYQTREAFDGPSAVEAVRARCPNLVILDIWLGDSRFDGIKVLETIKQDYPDLPVVMMSGHGTVETAVSAIKKGAYDFIEKPFKTDRLLLVLERALEASGLRKENESLKALAPFQDSLLGGSSALQNLLSQCEKIAASSGRVVLYGPTGSGREDVARYIHGHSKRSNGPFVRVPCGILSEEVFDETLFGTEPDGKKEGSILGLLEQAHQGTLMLEDVGDLPKSTQQKLVKLMQEGSFLRVGGTRPVEVDVRLIGSSSVDLGQLVTEGRVREDFYNRLKVHTLKVPSLKDRREDIPVLAQSLLTRGCHLHGVPPKTFGEDAIIILQSYDWPGNIRHLKNVIEWVIIMSESSTDAILSSEALPSHFGVLEGIRGRENGDGAGELLLLPLREAREVFEKNYLLGQLNRFSGNISQTAQFVGMERSALHRKLRSLNLTRHEIEEDNS